MPINVPDNPKVFTTKYDNFRGVDFTNDPSNVWSHRSPNGKNITPDLAGRPWKRTGWEIAVTTQDFIDVYNETLELEPEDEGYVPEGTPVMPQKTNYFELGGVDYLAIVNSLGLFFYSKFIGNKAKEKPYLIYIDRYYVNSTPTVTRLTPNPNRSFFFEGQGTAGFYVFCSYKTMKGLVEVDMTEEFMFDGERLQKVEPHVPEVMIGKESGLSGGTLQESPNLLTQKRIVKFYCDGTGTYYLPERADLTEDIVVEVVDDNAWVVETHYTTEDTADGTKIVFAAGYFPPAATDGDNMRVTYSLGGSVAEIYNGTGFGNIVVTSVQKQTRVKTITTWANSKTRIRQGEPATYKTATTSPWKNAEDGYSESILNATLNVSGLMMDGNTPNISVYFQDDEQEWENTPVDASLVDAEYISYSSTLSLDVTDKTGAYHVVNDISYSDEKLVSTEDEGFATLKGKDSATAVRPISRIYETYEMEITTVRTYPVKIDFSAIRRTSSPTRNAFEQCIRSMVFGDGIINSVFFTGSPEDAYRSRVWWSAPTDPTYFPDINYFEAGSNDTGIAGLIKVDEYLGVIKQGESLDSTIYLAYQTKIVSGSIVEGDTVTTTYDDTFAVKSSIGGIGAISNGAFNVLNSEPLFLSKEGVMGIEPTNEKDKQLRNRSFFVNKRLKNETRIENAISFVYRNMYILCVNNHCYILDGSQKSSWANEKTNLQYECYYWENVPAQCFARYENELWFCDRNSNLCRFKPYGIPSSYHDDYVASTGEVPIEVAVPEDSGFNVTIEDEEALRAEFPNTGKYIFTYSQAEYMHRTHLGRHFPSENFQGQGFGNTGHLNGASPRDNINTYLREGKGWYVNGAPISDLSDYGLEFEGEASLNTTFEVTVGAKIDAVWSTPLDDDGSAHYFKTLQKKGTMVALYPQSTTGVNVYIRRDNKKNDPLYVGKATIRLADNEVVAPSDFYLKKKAKKYKRLQIIARNDGFDETFGIDEIIKCYILGNYSRNR